ncbi:hypothetical protein SAMN02745166_00867 [Prosthecobacter debontii]|uniref:DUF2892 domain-containing protein n=1 Tax=Prosthecobacter debontii TaxID=48467 RepID=A0A1T4WY05_9BACT|nr:hypothetical protein [Prosthecobacter debontii]SKA82129.1 hypothetical protein SAMN02745166_00867 [Prosthecobacter debontii]
MHLYDPVQQNTEEALNEQIEASAKLRVGGISVQSREEISRRIEELDQEWDIERWLECNASFLAFSGLLLGLVRNKKYFIVPGIVLPFLFNHAVRGWCPPIPLLRRLGIRTRREIDHEKYALKALRGDFSNVVPQGEQGIHNIAEQAWEAARP